MNESLELTAWMPGRLHPAREGVYERRNSDGAYSCWNGALWNRDAETPVDAAAQTIASRDQNASWRGCVERSELPCATCKGHSVIDRGHDDETGQDLIQACPDC